MSFGYPGAEGVPLEEEQDLLPALGHKIEIVVSVRRRAYPIGMGQKLQRSLLRLGIELNRGLGCQGSCRRREREDCK